MPSVRELASQLAINPNTIQRAYRELEAEGYIYSIPGKGSFAGEHREVDETRKAELFKKFDDIVTELRFLGVGTSQLIERMNNAEQKEGKRP
jgi:GntR family transcriptional regulator